MSVLARCCSVAALVLLVGAVQAQDREAAPDPARPSVPPGTEVAVDTVVLQGLDKITARVSTFAARFDQPVRFGSLEIMARTCHKRPPEEPPEHAAFLEIVDVRPDSPAVPLFTGWMFASSPALSSLEHPVYDVWVIDCRTWTELDAANAAAASEAATAAPDAAVPENDPETPERPED